MTRAASWGFRVIGTKIGTAFNVDDLRAPDGSPLVKPSYRVALNTYDSQSAGERFPIMGRLVAQRANKRVLQSIEIRDTLIDFFVTRQKISRSSLLV